MEADLIMSDEDEKVVYFADIKKKKTNNSRQSHNIICDGDTINTDDKDDMKDVWFHDPNMPQEEIDLINAAFWEAAQKDKRWAKLIWHREKKDS
jgi:hypothetical protein